MRASHFGKLKKVDGVLVPATKKDEIAFNLYKESLQEGAVVEVFMEEGVYDGTIPQLRLVHSMIEKLASHTGDSIDSMKMLVKEKAGLCLARTSIGTEYFLCISFADCSAIQLSAAIQAAIEIGVQINFPLE